MGLSSSQARLLSLTGRMHDIEYKAQKLEAQKLQMANESKHVYKKYEDALNSYKIQAATLGADGSTKFIDADLLVLENNTSEKVAKNIFLKNTENDKIYVSRLNADKYNLSETGNPGTEIEFMTNAGFESTILNFNTIQNSQPTDVYSTTATTVKGSATTREVPNFNPNWGYQTVASDTVPADSIRVSNVTTAFDPSKTYTIKDVTDLKKLQSLTNSGVNTQGIKFVLMDDIDMTGVTWTGIGNSEANAFKGIFDGNGHTISNLKGSSGLFTYVKGDATAVNNPTSGTNVTASYGVIKDVIVQNVTINKTSNEAGALICKNMGGYVDNCYASGNITAGNWVGGLIGHNIKGAVTSSTCNVNINATGNCVGGFIGHDTNGVMEHCISTGTVDAKNGYAGGFIGHETSSGSNFIYECATTSNVVLNKSNTGAFLGQIDAGCTSTVINSQYSGASGLTPVGSAQGTITSNGNDSSLTEGSTRIVTTTNITIPSKASVKSNILMALDKANTPVAADFETKLDTWLNKFYKEDTHYSGGVLVEDALKLASINDFLSDYINKNSNTDIANLLVADITNNSITATQKYQDKYKATKTYEYTPYASNTNVNATKTTKIQTGSIDNIANNIYTAIRKSGNTNFSTGADITKIKNWLTAKFSTANDTGKLELAELNNYITDYISGNADGTELNKIINSINSNTTYRIPTAQKIYNAPNTTYEISMVNAAQTPETGWDAQNAEQKEALEYYNIIKGGYIIVEDEQAASKEWLVNLIDMGIAIFTEWNNATKSTIETNLATNVTLQEVVNEVDLKKAEAEYEASMRKIDDKDKRYDTELAALENERNAIKTEMETLKTVAKDNVDRTFKLFG